MDIVIVIVTTVLASAVGTLIAAGGVWLLTLPLKYVRERRDPS